MASSLPEASTRSRPSTKAIAPSDDYVRRQGVATRRLDKRIDIRSADSRQGVFQPRNARRVGGAHSQQQLHRLVCVRANHLDGERQRPDLGAFNNLDQPGPARRGTLSCTEADNLVWSDVNGLRGPSTFGHSVRPNARHPDRARHERRRERCERLDEFATLSRSLKCGRKADVEVLAHVLLSLTIGLCTGSQNAPPGETRGALAAIPGRAC